jgi:hypothetical protein
MKFSKSFFKLAAFCALLSGLTTLGVHLLPRLYAGPADFERVVSLHANPVYLSRLWIVVLHILLVVASVWGIAARKLKDDAGLTILGFLGYLLFAAAELFRTALGLYALNRGWRAAYAQASDEAVKATMRTLLAGWPGVNDGLFFLLVLGFLIGNLLYGLVLVRQARLERFVGVALLVWAALGLCTLLNVFGGIKGLVIPEWHAWTYQPAVRFLIAAWLWQTPTQPG